jgi:glycosyltransferase involved in cell wall biosynthesis
MKRVPAFPGLAKVKNGAHGISSSEGEIALTCLATRRLDDRMPTIIQSLMRALGKRVRVLYIEPPVDPVFVVRRGRLGSLRPGVGSDLLTRFVPLQLPFEKRVAALAAFNRRLVLAEIKRALKRWARGRVVLWLPSPNLFWIAEALPDLPLCYYVSDDYRQTPSLLATAREEEIDELEARILERAEWVLVSSPTLLEGRKPRRGEAHWVPAGVDTSHFSKALDPDTRVPDDLAAVRRPVAGFIGALDDYKVDFALLDSCARALPNVSFVTIGPIDWAKTNESILPRGANIHHLGWRPYDSLPAYLRGFDVALLPNRTTGYMVGSLPMKLVQYLAAKLPVVATNLPTLEPFAPWIDIGMTEQDYIRKVRQAVERRNEPMREEGLEIAMRNSWDFQATRVLAILNGEQPDPVVPPSLDRKIG